MPAASFALHLFGGIRLTAANNARPIQQIPQPKRLALLAFVACHQDLPPTRDRLCALFWPELDEEAARHALRQALYALRRDLRTDLLLATRTVVQANPAALWCDAVELATLIDQGEFEGASRLHTGDFLDGFHVPGVAPEFEDWVDRERRHLRTIAADAAQRVAATLAREAPDEGRLHALLDLAERLQPLDERVLRRRLELLAAGGNRGAVREAYKRFAARMRDQLDVDPSPESHELALRLCVGSTETARAPVTPNVLATQVAGRDCADGEQLATGPSTAGVTNLRQRPRAYRQRLLGSVVTMALLVTWVWRGRDPQAPVNESLLIAAQQARCAGDLTGARALFLRAEEDAPRDPRPSFGLFQVSQALGRSDAVDALHRAVERADGAAEPYQQLIVAEWHAVRNSPAWRSVAIALWNRYPTDASAHMAGRALLWSGDFVGARRVAREAMQRPTIVHEAPGACRRSDLFDIIVAANLLMDSLPQAEAAAREWLAADPTSGASAWRLAEVLQRHGDPNEALRLIQQALQPTDPRTTDDVPYRIMLAVRHGELAEAERWLAPRRLDARAEVREEALWWTAILRREEGRPAEGAAALALARRQIDASERSAPSAYASLQAQLALESGDHAGAIALFDSIAALPPDPLERLDTSPGGLEARRRVWRLLHLATAIAASGDTVRLAPLVDTLRVLGARSGFGRDRRSHYFADALLQLSRGDTATAIQSLRASMYSPTEGFTRANLILGQLLTRTGDSESAVEVLEAAMRGALEGSNLFVARRELRSALRDALRQGARSRREA